MVIIVWGMYKIRNGAPSRSDGAVAAYGYTTSKIRKQSRWNLEVGLYSTTVNWADVVEFARPSKFSANNSSRVGSFPKTEIASSICTIAHHPRLEQNTNFCSGRFVLPINNCSLRGCIRKNWNDTEKISMAPAQG